MILPRLALRNVRLSLRRRLFVATVIALTLAVLLVGNTVFQSTETGIQQTYRNSFTGDLSVSADSETSLTVFGNELPLVGDYEVLPVLADPKGIEAALSRHSSVVAVAHQVSAAAYLQVGGLQKATPLFGVDFAEYLAFFPALQLTEGSVPASGSHSILINSVRKADLEAGLGRMLQLGEPIQLVSTNAGGFTIREVAYAGAYQYPVGDELINRIVLVDADTARALNGYVYGGQRTVTTNPNQTQLLTNTANVDDLFGESDDTTSAGEALSLGAIDQALATHDTTASVTVDGAWNFLLVRLKPGTSATWEAGFVKASLPGGGADVQVRDWRGTAGGNAQLVYFVRLLFNVGMILLVLIAIFVMTNALALSVYERTREIGTMRAVGATRSFVAQLLTLETLILVAGAGIVGLALGVAALEALGQVGIPLTNPLIAALFGTSLIRPTVLWDQVGWHLVLAVLMGGLALLLPLRVALRVSPVSAMAKEA